MAKRPLVALVLNTHKPYDRQVVEGIAEYVRRIVYLLHQVEVLSLEDTHEYDQPGD